jgi:hypothetical protein
MTAAVQRLLDAFDALSDAEKHQAALGVVRRLQQETPAALPDAALVQAAEELFRDLDAREAADGRS